MRHCVACGEPLNPDREIMVRGDGCAFCATCGFLDKFMPGLLSAWLDYRRRGEHRPEPWDWDE